MKEEKIFVDEEPDEDDGWTIVETKTEKIKNGLFSEKVIIIKKATRDITPVKIEFSGNITLPKWEVEQVKNFNDIRWKLGESNIKLKNIY